MIRSFSRARFEASPLIGILRGFRIEQTREIINSAQLGGLTNVEITMDSPEPGAQIREAVAQSGDSLNIGAGTVASLKLLEKALEAGASFIVTPALVLDVVQCCIELRVPVFPGAASPTEIARAWEAGATMVKLFPAEFTGPAYIRSLKAPFPRIRLLPTGGVSLETLEEYVQAGADGFGLGSPLFSRARIDAGDWDWVEKRCRAFASAFERARLLQTEEPSAEA
jgi:2-dehydro-3-deoxyphosphogluconate aldolase / (4S)-4-hydroxy-2-oxoglutarate aldolase